MLVVDLEITSGKKNQKRLVWSRKGFPIFTRTFCDSEKDLTWGERSLKLWAIRIRELRTDH